MSLMRVYMVTILRVSFAFLEPATQIVDPVGVVGPAGPHILTDVMTVLVPSPSPHNPFFLVNWACRRLPSGGVEVSELLGTNLINNFLLANGH